MRLQATAVFSAFVMAVYGTAVAATTLERSERQNHQHSDHSDRVSQWLDNINNDNKPNVLFLISDDMRPKLGCYGDDNMVTPNIDQLASKSLLFNRAYVQAALCGPSRTSFLTSRRPDTTRVLDLKKYWRTVAGDFTTLPQHFKNNGYFTQNVGKIFHPGSSSGGDDDFPQSWSVKAEHPHGGNAGIANRQKPCPGADNNLHDNLLCPVNVSRAENKTLVDIQIADFAVNFLKNYRHQHHNKPFFLAAGFIKPHMRWRYPQEFKALYPLSHINLPKVHSKPADMPSVAWYGCPNLKHFEDSMAQPYVEPYGPFPDDYIRRLRQGYSSCVSYVDDQVGRVLEALDQAGFSNNTIITFMGDHGWSLGEHGQWCKQSNFEITTRIPFMISVPGVTTHVHHNGHNYQHLNTLQSQPGSHQGQGLTTDQLMEAVDIFPTLAELTKLDVPPTCPADSNHVNFCTEGSSLVPVLKHATDPTQPLKWKDAAFSQYPRHHLDPHEGSPHYHVMGYTMRTDTHRYTEWVHYNDTFHGPDWSQMYARELYDHQADPEENFNQGENPGSQHLVQQLSQRLHKGWRHSM